jgi:FkbM family methyltransferase
VDHDLGLVDFQSYLREPLEFDKEIARFFDDQAALVIFEVGACEGEDTLRLKRRFPNASIYAFEPLPENVTRVEQNLDKYGVADVPIFRLALSDSTGTSEFHVSSGHPDDVPQAGDWDYGNKSSSLLPPKELEDVVPWLKFERTILVETMRLDRFVMRTPSRGSIWSISTYRGRSSWFYGEPATTSRGSEQSGWRSAQRSSTRANR